MILKYITLVIGTVFELYSTNLYLSSFINRKPLKDTSVLITHILITLFQIIVSCYTKGIVLLICSFITAFVMSQTFISKQYEKIILSLTVVIINIASELITSGLLMLTRTVEFEYISSDPYLFAVGTLISKFIMFVLILIVYFKKIKLKVENIESRHLIILSVLPLTTILIIIIMYQVMFAITSQKLKLMFVIASMLVIVSNIITFTVVNRQNRLARTEYELKLLKENIAEQEKHYIDLQTSHEEIRKMRHDMKNMCIATIAEIKAGNIIDAISELGNVVNDIEETNLVIDTGHPSIDTIVESKFKVCKEYHIITNISFQYKAKVCISEIEIAVIIGNVLDNAIESCKRTERQEREIWGIVEISDGDIIINIKNTAYNFKGYKTLKNDKKNHGYGLKSIVHIANKHNGYAKFDYEDDVFNSYVFLENKHI